MARKKLKTIDWPNAAEAPGGASACVRRDNPGRPPRGRRSGGRGVTLVGFDAVEARSAHTEASVAAAARRAVARCERAWGWSPTNLTVALHDGDRSFGIARSPGDGPRVGMTVVSLSCRLLAEYDAKSVVRVLVHELCHHYREESFRRTRDTHRRGGHDAVFCEALAEADPKSGGPHRCRKFTDERSPREENPSVSWSPRDGALALARVRGRGQMLFWRPRRRGAWDPVDFLLTDGELYDLARRFSPRQRSSMRVAGAGMTLAALLTQCAARREFFPSLSRRMARGEAPFDGRSGR